MFLDVASLAPNRLRVAHGRIARIAFCQSCDLGHVDFLLYCPVSGLKESVSETRIVFKNCCSKVYFLKKPVPHSAYFHQRIIHVVCSSSLCLILEKKIPFQKGFTLKVKLLLFLLVICMFLLYLS